MRCPICGTKNKPDAVECVACGNALNVTPAPEDKKDPSQKKKGKKQNATTSEQTTVSTEEVKEEEIYEQGMIPVVIINAKEKDHIPMNIEYNLESEKFLEEEEEEKEDDDDEALFWRTTKKKPTTLITNGDTLIYICMGILGFLLVFAISYLAINIVLKDMGNDNPTQSTPGVEQTTEGTSTETEEPSTEETSTEETSTEESSSYDKEKWLWEDTFWVEVVDGEAQIVEYVGTEEVVRIPAEFDGYPLTSIQANTFEDCTSMKALEVPEGVVEIGDYAFAGCSNLKVIALPESLLSMGEGALDGVGELYVISQTGNSYGFSLGLQQGNHWVYGNGLPEDVSQWVEESTTEEPTTTTEEESTTTIPPTEPSSETETQPPSSSVAPVVLPDETYWEPEWIFRVEGGVLTVVKYRGPGGVVTVPSEYKGMPTTHIGKAAFQLAENVTHIVIPDTIVSIGQRTMADMKGCVLVTIPASVTSIDDTAFEDSGAITIRCPEGSTAHTYTINHPPLIWENGYGL